MRIDRPDDPSPDCIAPVDDEPASEKIWFIQVVGTRPITGRRLVRSGGMPVLTAHYTDRAVEAGSLGRRVGGVHIVHRSIGLHYHFISDKIAPLAPNNSASISRMESL